MSVDGSCKCGEWRASLSVPASVRHLSPRICDCDYCKAHPSSLVSDPQMQVSFAGGKFTTATNGDRLATFYYCSSCGDFLAVGRELEGALRGAVSGALFADASIFSEPTFIQPKLLSASEKLERWRKLWGTLNGL